MEKVQIDQWIKDQIDQWERSERPMENVRIEKRIMFDEVRIDHWSGSESTNGQGPNYQGPDKIGSKLTRVQ